MAYTGKGDWVTLSIGGDVETRIEPVKNDEGVTVSFNKDYRTVYSRTVMETFSNQTDFPDPVVEPPVTGEEKITSENYTITQKETRSGEHMITYQKASSWASY